MKVSYTQYTNDYDSKDKKGRRLWQFLGVLKQPINAI